MTVARDLAALGYRCVILEKTDRVGGVWAMNDYPGLSLKASIASINDSILNVIELRCQEHKSCSH